MIRHQLPHGEIIHARVEEVYPTLTPGSVTLCHVDGPYGLSKAEWDKVKDLAAWYRPHIAEWGRVCAPSASVYLWNTAEGWAAIHPEMVAAGWTLEVVIVWDKQRSVAIVNPYVGFADTTEVCGQYWRGERRITRLRDAPTNVWTSDLTNFDREKLKAGFETVRSTTVATNALHPCQKPLLFARRIVEASSRPGDLVFEPFGGTCRIAAACEAIGRYEPENARRYVCVEMDEDGRDYIPAVLAALRGDLPSGRVAAQVGLFSASKEDRT